MKKNKKVIDKKATDREALKWEYLEAIKKLKIAEMNFELAEPEFVELACAELNAAMVRIDTLRKNFLLTKQQ